MFDYSKTKKENITCNLCGSDDFSLLAKKSKNNLPVATVMCRNCSLIYINPRMTSEDYDNYYKYFYRVDRNTIKGTTTDTRLERNFENARKFGRALGRRYQKFFKPGLAVDVGSSTGGVLYGLREALPALKILGIEPSVAESELARSRGVPTKTVLFENFRDVLPEVPANIFCVQSLNHLLDPKGFMAWAYEALTAGGSLFLAVKNFRHQARRAGSIEAGVQIDHPYMFTPETLRAMIESVSFRIVVFEIDEGKSQDELLIQRAEGLPRHHIRVVAVKDNLNKVQVVLPSFWAQLKLRLALSWPILKLFYLAKYSHWLTWQKSKSVV
ncbi:MAG: methyltransferase domain-containing protein [Patescibacteria group bacterium]